MATELELDPVDWISAGALGEPGERTFFLQASKFGEYVGVVVEKEQCRALAEAAEQVLAPLGVTFSPADLDRDRYGLEPIVPSWRVGMMSLGSDEARERFLLELRELTEDEDEPSKIRLWMRRAQLIELAARAQDAVQNGGRRECSFCGEQMEPDSVHLCAEGDGRGTFTV